MNTAMTRLIVAAFAFLLTQSALAGIKIEHWVSSSGARVYFVESRVLPMLDVQVDFAAGSMFDPVGKAGLAALTRATLDNGAGKLDETAIAEQLADIGANLGGSADTDRASVSLRTLSARDKRDTALAILKDVLQAPHFDAAVFEREKARTIAGLKEAMTRPDSMAGKAFWAALYPNHPYGRQATPESVAALNRDDMAAFHARYYNAANASITLVGDLSRQEAEKIADAITAGMPKGQAATLPGMPEIPKGGQTRIAHPASQAHVYIGLPAIERGNPDFFPLLVGNYTLGGGGFVSRLTREVREKRGFAYSVFSYFAPRAVAGPFQIGLQTRGGQVEDALAVVNDTLAAFIADGPSEEEMEAARANIINGFGLRLDSNRKILDHVAMIGFYGLPLDWLDTYPGHVAAVSAEAVRDAFARRVRSEHLITVVAGGDGDEARP